jgi:hypothetical protein
MGKALERPLKSLLGWVKHWRACQRHGEVGDGQRIGEAIEAAAGVGEHWRACQRCSGE